MGLIKTKRSSVAMNCSTIQNGVSPLEYSALVIVELYPIVKRLLKDDDAVEFGRLIVILESVKALAQKHNYSKSALVELIKEQFLSKLTLVDLKEIIKESAYCWFPSHISERMLFKEVSKNPPLLRNDYGDEAYVRREPVVNEPVTKAKKEPEQLVLDSREIAQAKKEMRSKEDLTRRPEIAALKRKYNQLKKPGKRYYWEWRVSTADYEEYQALLRNIDFQERTRDKVRLCAHQLAFYIAEWYKREYDGFNTSGCLDDLGISSSLNKEIWDYSHDKGDRPYCTPDTHINSWLYSMYVQGGFPIKYTMRATRFAPLFDEIWGDDRRQDTISEEQLFELTLGFDGNQVVKNSLISGSLHDYYRYLRIQETMPIAESDMDKDPFSEFIRNLQEGKKKFYEQYLKPVWYLYLDPRDEIIEGVVKVSFGRRDDNCYIPNECLQYWGIPGLSSLKEFDIEVADSASGVSKSIHFTKAGPDDYPFVGWSQENTITLPISYETSGTISVSLVTISGRHPIGNPFKMEDSRQFYKTKKPYEWSSKTDNSAHTAILFNPIKLTLCDSTFHPEDKIFQDGGLVWHWLILTEPISLIDESGFIISYAPRNSSLEIIFKPIPNTIKYVNFRDVVHHSFVEGEHIKTAVTLLREKGFSVCYTPYGGNKPENVPLSQCSVLYKRPGDNRFISWGEANQPGQGLMQLRVIYEDKGVSATRLVYYLPQTNPITRITKENLIIFGNNLKDIYAPGVDSYMPLARDEGGKIRYHDDIVNGYTPQSDTIPFLLGKPDDDYVTINIFRSAECKELYLQGTPEPIKRYKQGNGIVDIPVILRRYFEVRTINNSGVMRVKCGDDVYLRFDSHFYANYYVDGENGLRYYTVMNERTIMNEENAQVTYVLETSPTQYRFFYWSMNAGEEPIALEQISYNPNDKHLVIDISPLKKNNKGIVFQSLKGGVTPRHYFGPIFGSHKDPLDGRQKLVQCFDVASEHNIPFILFPCFQELFSKPDVPFYLSKFWVELMASRDWKPTVKDYTNLHRFAYEFIFDWIMLPKAAWSHQTSEWRKLLFEKKDDSYKSMARLASKDILLKLFRTSPYIKRDDRVYLEMIIERYWTFRPNAGWAFHRSQKPDNILAQCIRGNKGDYSCFVTDYAKRISNLKLLHESKTLYEDLYRLMIKKTQ